MICGFFEEYEHPVYVSDPETYALLYVNSSFREHFGQADAGVCYQIVRNRTSPCHSCNGKSSFQADSNSFTIDEFCVQSTGRWYRRRERPVQWSDGRTVRCTIAEDITREKEFEDTLHSTSEDLRMIRLLNELTDRSADLSTIIQQLSEKLTSAFSCYVSVFLTQHGVESLKLHPESVTPKISNWAENLVGAPLTHSEISLTPDSLHSKVASAAQPMHFTSPADIEQVFQECLPSSCEKGNIRRLIESTRAEAVVVVPLFSSHKLIGTINLSRQSRFSDKELNRLRAISSQLVAVLGRLRSKEALRMSEAKYRALAESARDMIFIVDPAGYLQYANTTCCAVMHATSESIIGKRLSEIFPASVSRRQMENIREVSSSQEPRTVEAEIIAADGSPRWLSTLLVPINDIGPACVMGISRDITKRIEAENTLRESEEKFRSLAEQSPNMIFIFDGNRHFYMNNRIEELLGYSREEFYAEDFDYQEIIAPESRPLIRSLLERQFSGEKVPPFEHALIAKNGRRIDVISSMRLIHFEGKRAVLGTVIDITEQKKTRREKEQMQAQLVEAQKMEAIGTLTGGIAHDFNNMITGIRGFTQLALLEVEKDNPIHDDLTQIEQVTRRAGTLTRQLLLFSRRQPIELSIFSPNETVIGLEKMLTRLIGEPYAIECRLTESPWSLHADQGKIEQIIMNLVVNARDAMPAGGKIIVETRNISITGKRAKRSADAREGNYVCLRVTDEGVGIDRTTLGRIFEPFFTTKESMQGTGLGLAVAYGIVKQHQGWIHVDSTPEKGSSFAVYLPAYFGEPETTRLQDQIVTQAMQNKGKVLLLEDEKTVCDFGQRALEMAGFDVIASRSIAEAQLKCDECRSEFVALFSDIVLPDGNGIDFADHLLSTMSHLKVLVASGYLPDQHTWERLKAHGYRFIQKPYDMAQLNARMDELLSTESRHSGSRQSTAGSSR